ncbi:hypothetical protein EWB00_000724 [Schistosoma japonicum]|uniref:Uncharacterized protein n=1 Tax=Schistosoma japonicum TaxID=6182 RepID=A0A4Z2DX27_SCHJA|nr:hypothetical protein EWB00_000724 [Schistosoma japonicum]
MYTIPAILPIACDQYQIIIYPLRPLMPVKMALILILLTSIISIINAIVIGIFNTISVAIRTPAGLNMLFERQPDKMVNSVQQREDKSMMFLINKLRNIDIEEEEESEIKENPKLGAYIFHCFGFICTCYLSLKSFQQTMNLLYTKQKNDSESCLTKLLTKLINEYSEHSVFGNVIADLVRQNRRCGLKNRNGPLGGNTISDTVHYHKKPTDTNLSTDKHERPIEDSPQPKSSYAKFRRRTSSYISETSFGTISYLDPSTKQTSLFQVSSILLTFRGSVVNTSSQTSLNENKKNEYSEQQHQQKPCDIQMPSILRFIHEYIKDSLLHVSTGISVFARKHKQSMKYETDKIESKQHLRFPDNNNVKIFTITDDKKTRFMRNSSDIFVSTSDEPSNLDDFAYISRMVSVQVMRKRWTCGSAQSVLIDAAKESRTVEGLISATNKIN